MKHIIFIVFLATKLVVVAQNLIPNPSVDFHTACPKHNSEELYLATPWEEFVADVDYYHSCSDNDRGKGRNCAGEIGIHVWWEGWEASKGYREYFGVKLTEPLKPGTKYYAEFWVQLAKTFGYATDDIGMYITTGKNYGKTKESFWNLKPQIENKQGRVLNDDKNWTKICGTYIAQGGEDYIVLGCFRTEETITLVDLNNRKKDKRCYYYFDDFYLGEAAQLKDVDSCEVKNITQDVYYCADEEEKLKEEPGILFPNVFTPNNDGSNDVFKPIPLPNHTVLSANMTIFNRWGEKLEFMENAWKGWDGKVNGQDTSDGVYYALIEYEDEFNFFGQKISITKKEKCFFHVFR